MIVFSPCVIVSGGVGLGMVAMSKMSGIGAGLVLGTGLVLGLWVWV